MDFLALVGNIFWQNLRFQELLVGGENFINVIAEGDLPSLVEPEDFSAVFLDLLCRMGHEYARSTAVYYRVHFSFALFSESTVAYRKHLVKY